MDWSPQQQAALSAIKQWMESGDQQVFRLFGYAGTGKSTLARYFGDMAGAGAQYAAFTGKAAIVMRNKGCLNARTIHSLIYDPHEKSKENLEKLQDELRKAIKDNKPTSELRDAIAEEKQNIMQPGFHLKPYENVIIRPDKSRITMFIIDEVSMVDERMGRDLLSFGIPILVLGDPAQLPPVRGAGFFTNQEPDIMLTEIHRQAEGNPIIALASHVREGNAPYDMRGRRDLEKQEWLDADQILVGTHVVRRQVINTIRRWLGFEGQLPMVGERLICLRNDWKIGLLNGSLWRVLNVNDKWMDLFEVTIEAVDEERTIECIAHKAVFEHREFFDWDDRARAQEFDFSYAITTHKSQGSQWNNVIYIDDWPRRDLLSKHRYTGITRAVENITVVRW